MTPELINFGCRLNAFEAEAMRGLAAGTAESGDTVIVNTCAVTAEAERQARQAIRRARRERPAARIVVTGCAAQIDPARWAAMPEVDRVLGNAEKLRPESFAPDGGPRIRVGDLAAAGAPLPPPVAGYEGRVRAVVQVQQGCDHRCTFCVIPFGRGPSRSLPAGAVVEQARRLVAAGYRELVLSGVDLTAWGADLPGRPALGDLVRRLLRLVPDLDRLRLSSLDPVEIDPALWRALAEEPRLMPHLHLSLQSGSDLILKRMKRRHDRAAALAACARARALRPDMALGADLIAGFPTEREEDAADSLSLIEEAGLAYVHVFPYSARPGTPAARMPALPGPVVKARAAALRARAAAAQAAFTAAQAGRVQPVLAEHGDVGRTESYALVRLSGIAPGTLLPLHIERTGDGALAGRRLAA